MLSNQRSKTLRVLASTTWSNQKLMIIKRKAMQSPQVQLLLLKTLQVSMEVKIKVSVKAIYYTPKKPILKSLTMIV